MNLSFSEVLFLLRRGLINKELVNHATAIYGDPQKTLEEWRRAKTACLVAAAVLVCAGIIIYSLHREAKESASAMVGFTSVTILLFGRTFSRWRACAKAGGHFVKAVNDANALLWKHPSMGSDGTEGFCLHHPIDKLRMVADDILNRQAAFMYHSHRRFGISHSTTRDYTEQFETGHAACHALNLCRDEQCYLEPFTGAAHAPASQPTPTTAPAC